MMRSLFSGVSGLKTHQTRMDVIGNNIANVNTTAYKSQNMVFSDLLYQQTQAASGANADTGRGGINARQIGLGAKTAAINTAITRQGSAQSTNNPWDVMITGESFFIVNSGNGGQNFFTRDGSFTIDGAGNLVMASTGYRVMGWQVDPDTGEIQSGPVAALQVMNAENMTAPAEASSMGIVSGILDKNDPSVNNKAGLVRTLQFFDARGYSYTAKFSIHAMSKDGDFYVQLDDITDDNGESLKDYYNVSNIGQIAQFGADNQTLDPVTKVYTVPDTVDYTPPVTTGGTTTPAAFLVNQTLADMLEGFANDPMMALAGNPKIVGNKGTETGGAVKPGTMPAPGEAPEGWVTVEGSSTLSQTVLQENYGITFDKEKGHYYFKDGNDVVELPDEAREDAQIALWQKALSKLTGSVRFQKPAAATDPAPVKRLDDGSVQVTFQADFKPTRTDLQFNDKAGLFALKIEHAADGSKDKEILEQVYNLTDKDNMTYKLDYITPNGYASVIQTESYSGNMLHFDTDTGKFVYIGGQGQDAASLTFSASATDLTGETRDLGHFHDISIDFSTIRNVNNGRTSTIGFDPGDGSENNLGSGRKEGALIGVEIGQDGKIRASYDNGLSKLLGQIAVTKFANPAGLAKAGNNLYRTTLNSGEFDGVGIDITSDGEGSMESGVLEMSNVDLAGEFTEMITTQRGFQANSRIITTSDSMLEELVNLKR